MLDFRNVNSLWASVLVETLHRLGLTTAICCPGSRSTPLTLAFAQHPVIKAIPVLDERSAAFFALGIAKASQQPVALVCTSGTAGANFYPAVIEAKETHTPLLILTADRPPELHHCHAGQTIDQIKLYGNYPNWQTQLSTPGNDFSQLVYLRQTIVHAWESCLFPPAGVVHLNIPFRDPLPPIADGKTPKLETGFDADSFFSHLRADFRPPLLTYHSPLPKLPPNGLIIAGVEHYTLSGSYCQAIAHLSRCLGYPVLAEALSPVRNHAHLNPNLVTGYDLLLRHPAPELEPEIVIQIGELPTSKELRQWLEKIDPPRLIISPHPDNFDPLHGKTRHIRTRIETVAQALGQTHSHSYCQIWCDRDRSIRENIIAKMDNTDEIIEAKVAYLLSRHLPPQTPIFIANSMPIRYMEWFWLPNMRRYQPYFNRGANGIDGTLSTALGIAYKNNPSVLLTGDLALLHDTNGFLSKKHFTGSLTIVLINNDGGGIFEMLPIAGFAPYFEDYFATPTGMDFERLCGTYGVEHHLIKDWGQLIKLLNPLPQDGIRVIEVRSDRSSDAQWLQKNLKELGRVDS